MRIFHLDINLFLKSKSDSLPTSSAMYMQSQINLFYITSYALAGNRFIICNYTFNLHDCPILLLVVLKINSHLV